MTDHGQNHREAHAMRLAGVGVRKGGMGRSTLSNPSEAPIEDEHKSVDTATEDGLRRQVTALEQRVTTTHELERRVLPTHTLNAIVSVMNLGRYIMVRWQRSREPWQWSWRRRRRQFYRI